MRHKFPINGEVLRYAEVCELGKIINKSFSGIEYFLNEFTVMILQDKKESEDDAINKLESEFCKLQIANLSEEVLQDDRIDRKWAIYNLHLLLVYPTTKN